MTNFKQEYLTKDIPFEQIHNWIEKWHTSNVPGSLQDFLGFNDEEMLLFVHGENKIKDMLEQMKAKRIASTLKKALAKVVNKDD